MCITGDNIPHHLAKWSVHSMRSTSLMSWCLNYVPNSYCINLQSVANDITHCILSFIILFFSLIPSSVGCPWLPNNWWRVVPMWESSSFWEQPITQACNFPLYYVHSHLLHWCGWKPGNDHVGSYRLLSPHTHVVFPL